MHSAFVLIAGAFHGGWAWRNVAGRLNAAGHAVLCPTLTGLGDRQHLGSAETNLSDHIRDVVAAVACEELESVTLVGHSYGGLVAAGTAAAMPDRIASIIFLDAVISEHGRCMLDMLTASDGTMMRAAASNGWLPPPPVELLGVPAGKIADWLARRLCPHPMAALEEPLQVLPDWQHINPHYIACMAPDGSSIARQRQHAEQLGWPVSHIEAGHEALVTHSDDVATMLLQLAA